MKQTFIFLILLFSTALLSAQNLLEVKTFTLSNGMEVWINEDHSLPKAYGAVVVKAGARDCPETGIAHYFEHIMFKGTEKIGTLDYAAEKPYLDSIAVLYDRLAEVPEAERAAIQKEINRLNIAASRFAVPNEFNNLISTCGGSSLNAYTSNDVTVYHNEFVSAYFEQWAELNSERLINPVFRLFQGELETVYEEKNKNDSNEISAFAQMITAEGYKGTPYQYPVIGTTENLKNPRLSQMAEFFEKYYVAGNMGLMLTGDIYPEKALPVLEHTFGRIRKGTVERQGISQPAPFKGQREVIAPVKIPFVKLSAICFRGPSRKDPDCLPMSLMAFMLNNSEGIGLLDKLMTDKQILAGMCMYPDLAFEESGLFPVLILPKLLFQSNKKAENKVLAVLEQLKKGDFSEAFFESCKMTYRKHLVTELESLQSRMNEMVHAYAQGKDWQDVLRNIDAVDALTKEDMVTLADKYFTEDRLVVRKKYGNPDKDDLQKPPYDKITPKGDVSSAYADALRAEAERVTLPRLVIDYENDAHQREIRPLVNLYTVANPVNDVFNLSLSFPVGTMDNPSLERVASYLSLLGTETMDYQTHRTRLQAAGGSLAISGDRNRFRVEISGFDKRFAETVSLVADLVEHPKGDKKKLSILKESDLTNRIMNRRDLSTLGSALVQYLRFGERSYFLRDEGKYDSDFLLSALQDVLSYECDVHYSGNLPDVEVASALQESLFPERQRQAKPFYSNNPTVLPDETKVFFIPKKKSPQTRIYALIPGDCLTELSDRLTGDVAASYFGVGMGSVLFQEIREFRSLAYSTGAGFSRPGYPERERIRAHMSAFVGTQGDKTADAMNVLDSLIRHYPASESRFHMTQKDVWSEFVTDYPSFRMISKQIANGRRTGMDRDIAASYYSLLDTLSMADLSTWWERNVESRPIVWAVIGDPNKIGMENLAEFGPVTRLRASDVMR